MIIPSFENTHLGKSLLRDIFGIGAAASAVGSMANTSITNQTNKEIADEANKTQLKIHEDDRAFNAEEAEKARQFNAEEAEKARQFNAEEAQKSRDWNSETEVIKRRSEAGLNTSLTGQTSSSGGGSSAQASGPSASGGSASAPSAPNLALPTMHTIDMGGLMQGLSSLAKTQSEIDKNNAGAKNLINDAEHKAELAEYQRIVNDWTPKQFRASISEITSKTSLNKTEERLKNAQIEGFRSNLDSKFMEGFALYTQLNLQVSDFNQQVNEFLAQFPIVYEQLNLDAQKFEAEWIKSGYDLSYKWGSHKDSTHGWNVGLDAKASRGRSGSIPEGSTSINSPNGSTLTNVFNSVTKALGGVGMNVNGGYQDYDKVSNNFQNEHLYKYFVEGKALSNIASSPKYSKEIQDKALQRMQMLTLSVEGYGAFLMQLGKVKRFPNSLQQDLEDQQ